MFLKTLFLGSSLTLILAGQDHASRAMAFVQSGDLKSAEAELRKALALAPADPALLTSLGGVLGMEGDPQQANAFLERAVGLNPNDPASRRNLAANQWQLGKFAEARTNLNRLLRANPRDQAASFLLGMVYASEKDFARSAALLEAVPEIIDRQPEGWVALASSYYHLKRSREGSAALRRLSAIASPPALKFAGGQLALDAADYALAEDLFNSIRSAYPDPAAVEYQIALTQFRDHRTSQSRQTLLASIADKRSNPDTYILLAKLLSGEAAHVRALEIAKSAAELFPQSSEVFSTKASLEMQLQYFSDAVTDCRIALKLHKSAATLRDLAAAEWRAGSRDQAASDFELALQQFPQDAVTRELYGTLLLELDTSQAKSRGIALLKQALTLDNSSTESLYQLANAELAAGQPEQALPLLERAVKLNAPDSRVHYALSRVYQRLGRLDEAARELQAFQELKAANAR